MSMGVGMLDHYNVSTRNLDDTVRFYRDVLGFVNGPRPPFDFPGAWLYSDGHPVLHLNDISPTDKPQRPDSGVIDHIAFGSRGFEAMKRASRAAGHRLPGQRGAEQHAPADLPHRPEQRVDRAQLRRRQGSDRRPLTHVSGKSAADFAGADGGSPTITPARHCFSGLVRFVPTARQGRRLRIELRSRQRESTGRAASFPPSASI